MQSLHVTLKVSVGQERGLKWSVPGILGRKVKQEKCLGLVTNKNGRAEKGPCLRLRSRGVLSEERLSSQVCLWLYRWSLTFLYIWRLSE